MVKNSMDLVETLDNLLENLYKGLVIAYPTEAVFALGCDPDSDVAIKRLLLLKNRSCHKGLILIASSYSQLLRYIADDKLSENQRCPLLANWPGFITWIVPADPKTSMLLTGNRASLAVRVSNHIGVQQLCNAYGKPLVSTSANITGMPPCRSFSSVKEVFGINFPVLNGLVDINSNPSEIRDLISGKIMRRG